MICDKVTHKNIQGALKQCSQMEKKTGKKYTLYYCAHHNSYHITSKQNKKFINNVV